MGCTDPLRRGVGARTPSVSSRIGSKLPLPLYADVRFHIPMTCRNDVIRYGPEDGQAIRTHSFFKGVDWAAVKDKQNKPPFEPDFQGEEDTRWFDNEFTEQEPVRVATLPSPHFILGQLERTPMVVPSPHAPPSIKCPLE